jgi:hypothetical protein
MQVRLACECGREVVVTEGSAGASLPCDCGRSIKVPSLGELRQRGTFANVSRLPPGHQEQPYRLAKPAGAVPLVGCGALIFLLGVGLFIGNITGLFPTLPFAGFIVMMVGSLLFRAGRASGGGD